MSTDDKECMCMILVPFVDVGRESVPDLSVLDCDVQTSQQLDDVNF